MITGEKLKEKYEKIHEHFDSRDLLGFSALIFGLVFSGSSMEKNVAHTVESKPAIQNEQPKTTTKKQAKKKKVLKNIKNGRQQATASNE